MQNFENNAETNQAETNNKVAAVNRLPHTGEVLVAQHPQHGTVIDDAIRVYRRPIDNRVHYAASAATRSPVIEIQMRRTYSSLSMDVVTCYPVTGVSDNAAQQIREILRAYIAARNFVIMTPTLLFVEKIPNVQVIDCAKAIHTVVKDDAKAFRELYGERGERLPPEQGMRW